MDARVALVAWQWQHWHFALDTRHIKRLQPGQATTNTLLMHQLFCLDDPALPVNWLLECHSGEHRCQLGLHHEPRHIEVAAHQLLPLPAAVLAGRNSPCIRALVWYPEQPPMLLLDAHRLTPAAHPHTP